MRILLVTMLLVGMAFAQSHKRHFVAKLAEHVSLGAGVELGMYQIAGGSESRRLAVGLSSAGLVAGFKEASDAIAGADTRKMAAWHALSQMIGAGIGAGVRH